MHYPRWAGVALPVLYISVAVLLGPYRPLHDPSLESE